MSDPVGQEPRRSASRRRERRTAAWAGLLLLALAAGCQRGLAVGAKTFPESGILAEASVELAEQQGLPVRIRKLNGTKLCWSALLQGDIDAYPEYTGTIRQEIFSGENVSDDQLPELLARFDVKMTRPLGFNNTYALGVLPELAERLQLKTISDLAKHPTLRFGFSSEFVDRADGWPGLQVAYGLQGKVNGMQHSLGYEAIAAGDIDVIDVYSTDANVRRLGLVLLEDDRNYFPRYEAVFLYRADLVEHTPAWVQQMQRLEGLINDARMTALNERVVFDGATEASAAAEWLQEDLGIRVAVRQTTLFQRIAQRTWEHLWLTLTSLAAGILVAIPMGVFAAKRPLPGQFIVGFAEIVQTIPGLALLIFLGVGFRYLGWSVIGDKPVIAALFLYSLLPIVRNTMAGIAGVPTPLRESAQALGLTPWASLWRIELPMASPLILAGVKTTAVMIVGFAALGGLIGAGGYGQPIMTGLTLNDEHKMMEGAIPAALMALVVKWCFEYAERYLVPLGLRLQERQ